MILAKVAAPATAEDSLVQEGKEQFRYCKACHSIADAQNTIVAGGTNGPNLFGVIGRPAGALVGYNYSDGLLAAGQSGLIWTEENFVAFTANPNKFLFDFSN